MPKYIPFHLSRLLVKSPGHAARILLPDAEITVWMITITEAIFMVEKEDGNSIRYTTPAGIREYLEEFNIQDHDIRWEALPSTPSSKFMLRYGTS